MLGISFLPSKSIASLGTSVVAVSSDQRIAQLEGSAEAKLQSSVTDSEAVTPMNLVPNTY